MMEKKSQKSFTENASKYVKYSGLAFQMIAVIGVFAFIGYKIDEAKEIENFLFTALLSLIGVILSLYSVIKSLSKDSSSEN